VGVRGEVIHQRGHERGVGLWFVSYARMARPVLFAVLVAACMAGCGCSKSPAPSWGKDAGWARAAAAGSSATTAAGGDTVSSSARGPWPGRTHVAFLVRPWSMEGTILSPPRDDSVKSNLSAVLPPLAGVFGNPSPGRRVRIIDARTHAYTHTNAHAPSDSLTHAPRS